MSRGVFSESDYLLKIARNQISGAALFHTFGRVGGVAAVEVDVGELGGTYVFPPAIGIQLTLTSTNAADTQLVLIDYLDAAGNAEDETVQLAGLVPVATVATDIRRINAFQLASGNAAVGTVAAKSAGITYAVVAAGETKYRASHFTVPANKGAFLLGLYGSAVTEAAAPHPKSCELSFEATSGYQPYELLPGVFSTKAGMLLLNTPASLDLTAPLTFPGLTDMKLTAINPLAAPTITAMGGFFGFYEDA